MSREMLLIVGIMLNLPGRFIGMMQKRLDREVKVLKLNCKMSISRYHNYNFVLTIVNDVRRGRGFDVENSQASHGGKIGLEKRSVGKCYKGQGISYLQ